MLGLERLRQKGSESEPGPPGRKAHVTMQATQPVLSESDRLRRCMRDLAAFSSLFASLTRSDRREIASRLAEELCRVVPVAFVYVRLSGQAGRSVVEVAHTPSGPAAAKQLQQIGREIECLSSR